MFCTQDEEERYSRFKEFDLVRWHERSTDVLPSGGSKAEGIKKSLKTSVRQRGYLCVRGRSERPADDRICGNRSSDGQRCARAEKIADFITKPVDEDGIQYAVEALGLLKS
ncbi:hypothetical protein PO124_06265 [Bacillus licheniformis]|nr:hypothetical protein [Bacillus licheniformis]